ncbi:hypothetical protein M0811_08778 [Anaeramoeba ignava]|uniref:Uncharacterized protein n=1 Tax=Anaeramoeba ignava TaxID=1746090 RepID=A0A9Q0LLJ8_ANAIG|nr:hypothetical protein M0811_08778 [Anaeramoeba ignava]
MYSKKKVESTIPLSVDEQKLLVNKLSIDIPKHFTVLVLFLLGNICLRSEELTMIRLEQLKFLSQKQSRDLWKPKLEFKLFLNFRIKVPYNEDSRFLELNIEIFANFQKYFYFAKF